MTAPHALVPVKRPPSRNAGVGRGRGTYEPGAPKSSAPTGARNRPSITAIRCTAAANAASPPRLVRRFHVATGARCPARAASSSPVAVGLGSACCASPGAASADRDRRRSPAAGSSPSPCPPGSAGRRSRSPSGPIRLSILPAVAASVSTRVVSWNEAAEMKLLVCSEALVMPCSTGIACAGLSSSAKLGVDRVELGAVDLLAGQERRVARIEDLHLLQHLANDHLDVLVVDLHALQPVDVLDLVHQVVGQRLDARAPSGCRAARAGRRPADRPCGRSRLPAPRRACPSGSGTRSPRPSRRSSR